MSGLRVLAAMSGGVDSATAAARAADAGHDVTGVHLALSSNPSSYRTGARGCCTLEDARDARRAADVIGIPFYVWDMAERFHRDVVEDFVAEYAAGRTPNPCLRCNEKIKFAAVLDKALALGFDAVCTGHYARIATGSCTGPRIPARTSPTCWPCSPPSRLSHAMFPLGDTPKAQVRAEAARRGLAVADKPDSHDVCFIADGDTKGFLTRHLGQAPGQIVDESGAVLGRARRRLRLHRRPAQGPARRHSRRGRQASLRAGHRASHQDGHRGPRRRPGRHRDHRDPAGLDRLHPASRPVDCLVQLRAHGEVHGCTAWLDGRCGAHTPASPGARRGQGPGRRPLQRRRRPRQRYY